ncbi:hypothetical protein FFI39_002600 [Janthinobacterium sp. KBS0711]|uniref:hypothetical protein n=1 Tax=Janthinobacterium sp. KBS0711 TaxID=1649647 RepID=UPI00110F2068|nr:hypothetical protein [Janthinobacterium sp. KBS0711]TSD69999.1 hypothetical protein FFI39_002600 [Janthinobacterium sp. KBS0711]
MSTPTDKPPKIGTEITVRISLTFQEAPDVHTLLAMTPVRERGKLVRLALERYIAEIGHPAGDVEQQIHAISTWLRSRSGRGEATVVAARTSEATGLVEAVSATQVRETEKPVPALSELAQKETSSCSSPIARWLHT